VPIRSYLPELRRRPRLSGCSHPPCPRILGEGLFKTKLSRPADGTLTFYLPLGSLLATLTRAIHSYRNPQFVRYSESPLDDTRAGHRESSRHFNRG